jgi:ketosteroid isomerase-like protein
MGVSLGALGACRRDATMTGDERDVIAKDIDSRVRATYDLSQPNVDERMLSLYVDTGRIVSATGGRVVTSRDTLAQGIHYFWHNVGMNMREPKWIWIRTYVDVLSPTSAVFTGTYHVPHRTPSGEAHDIAGAMTLVFEKRGGKWGIVQEHLSDVPPVQQVADSSGKARN